jgi:hypothetical protein
MNLNNKNNLKNGLNTLQPQLKIINNEENIISDNANVSQPQLTIVNNKEEVISKTQKVSIEFNLIKSTLFKNHPELFKIKRTPLAHDIREQILDTYPEFNSKVVLKFLRNVFATARYLEAIVLNTTRLRYNLDLTTSYISTNNPSFISTEQRKTAANYLVTQLNNYKTEKGLKWFSTKQRKSFFNSLESLDHRFDTNRYFYDHEEFDRFLVEQENSIEQEENYSINDNMWPDNF